jgi:hypothetical protein
MSQHELVEVRDPVHLGDSDGVLAMISARRPSLKRSPRNLEPKLFLIY